MNHDTQILIVGAGAFGTSTAYHLAQRGYRSIRVLDRYAPPSCEAASTDISKVIRSDYNEPLYVRLGVEAIKVWETSELYRGLYHVPGWVLSAKELSVPFVKGSIETSRRLGVQGIEELTKDQIRQRFPMVDGALDDWNINVWNPTAGWANSGEALKRLARAAQEKGVEFISGDKGYVQSLIFSSSNPNSSSEDDHQRSCCSGVTTADGTTHTADVVIVAAGAWTPSLIDVQGQLIAKGHSVAHIQLTPTEQQHYQSMPVLDNLELDYFFPPGPDGVFKMAHSKFLTNTQKTDHHSGNSEDSEETAISTPHTFHDHPQDDLPPTIEASMRRNLARVFPSLASRPFSYTRLCWDADTEDRHFLIAPHPTYKGLFLACGGSAHGFKFMPVLGAYVADLLEGRLEVGIAAVWGWRVGKVRRTGDGDGEGGEKGGATGGGEGRKNLAHLDPTVELDSLTGWRGRREREKEREREGRPAEQTM